MLTRFPTGKMGNCESSGGSVLDGTIEITAIDSTSVSFQIAGVKPYTLHVYEGNAAYVTPRCP